MWIGLLYYFNFVQVDALKKPPRRTRRPRARASPSTWRRARSSSSAGRRVVTVLMGAMILGDKIDDALFFKERAYMPIGVGAWLGLIMFFNVWVLIWPNQKKILGIVPATDEEKNKARRVAFLASRTEHGAVAADAVLHGGLGRASSAARSSASFWRLRKAGDLVAGLYLFLPRTSPCWSRSRSARGPPRCACPASAAPCRGC